MKYFYHGSFCAGIEQLDARSRLHNTDKKVVYLTDNIPYALFYIWDEQRNEYSGKYVTGWMRDGVAWYEEQFPEQLKTFYKGVSGYLYCIADDSNMKAVEDRENMFYSTDNVKVSKVIQITDVYEEFLKYETEGKLKVLRFNEQSEERQNELIDFVAEGFKRSGFFAGNSQKIAFMKKHFPKAWEKAVNLEKIYKEEDLFPREIAKWEEREYGVLFYNEANKDSYDSNHGVIFKNRIKDLHQVLEDIIAFYVGKGMRPIIYQSISDEGYFEEIKDVLAEYGFESWSEEQKYMILSEENKIVPNPEIVVSKVSEWQDEYALEIFEKAGEPWEIAVARKSLANENTLFFVAYVEGKPVGMTYAHVRGGVCRVNYLLVSKEHRRLGVGRAIISSFVEYCNAHHIENCFLWPDGETAEKIYYEAGFRHVETKQAGRASYRFTI